MSFANKAMVVVAIGEVDDLVLLHARELTSSGFNLDVSLEAERWSSGISMSRSMFSTTDREALAQIEQFHASSAICATGLMHVQDHVNAVATFASRATRMTTAAEWPAAGSREESGACLMM